MSSKNERLNNITQEQGSSSWFTVLPLTLLGFSLSRAKFWDAVTKAVSKSLWLFKSLHSSSCVTMQKRKFCDFKAERIT